MPRIVDPGQFGLPARTALEEVDSRTLAIVIDRKSRLIMADGRKILEKAAMIRKMQPGCIVVLKTTAPVCSKTAQFLKDHNILNMEE